MSKVLEEFVDESGSVLISRKLNQNEVDSMSNVAMKQQARFVLSTGEFRSVSINESLKIHLSRVDR